MYCTFSCVCVCVCVFTSSASFNCIGIFIHIFSKFCILSAFNHYVCHHIYKLCMHTPRYMYVKLLQITFFLLIFFSLPFFYQIKLKNYDDCVTGDLECICFFYCCFCCWLCPNVDVRFTTTSSSSFILILWNVCYVLLCFVLFCLIKSKKIKK